MSITIDLNIFSPRWDHDDKYTLVLDSNSMSIQMQTKKAVATWRDNLDPEWSGDSIQDIMINDGIYPPSNIQELFEHAWITWRDGELNDKEVEKELQKLADWINSITRSKPDTELWNRYL
jgi:hypothetical protein